VYEYVTKQLVSQCKIYSHFDSIDNIKYKGNNPTMWHLPTCVLNDVCYTVNRTMDQVGKISPKTESMGEGFDCMMGCQGWLSLHSSEENENY
jgi:hypothetical protein